MDTVISSAQDRLAGQVTALKYVDEDWGQLDNYSPNFPAKWPCALIDVLDVQWSNIGKKVQMGLAQIRVKIADLRLSNSSKAAPAGQKANSNSFYTLTQQVYNALQGWCGASHYSAFIRISERRVQRDDGVKEHWMIFTTEIKDSSAMGVMTTLPGNSIAQDIATGAPIS
jgi:hypothetical protein